MNSSSEVSPGSQGPARFRRFGWVPDWRTALPWIIGLLAFLAILVFPQVAPAGAGYEADSSLALILSHAHQQALQFGTEYVYTHGPLGFLMFFQFSPGYAGAHWVVDVLIAAVAAAGLCMLAWRLKLMWRALLLVGYVWIAANSELRTDLLIDTGLLCFGLLCSLETGRRLQFCAVTLTLLAVFSALAKNSFLFVASAAFLLVTCDVFLRGERRVAIGMLAGFVTSFLGGWILAGQNPDNLWKFISNALVMVQGYSSALGWEEPASAKWIVRAAGLLLMGLAIAGTLSARLEGRTSLWRRGLLLAWIFILAFAAWKHGFVRAQNSNMQMFLGFMFLLAIALQVWPRAGTAERWVGGLGLLSAGFALLVAQWFFVRPVPLTLAFPFQIASQNLRVLLNPVGHLARMNALIEQHRQAAQLPRIRELVGSASVDVFGRRQAFAFFNDLNYQPRPVPQSYAAANAELMRLNEQFYLGPEAPSFVLFELTSLERKVAVLEDARVLRHILVNYEYITSEGDFLLLKRTSTQVPDLTLVDTQTVQVGDPANLPANGNTPLWLEIELQPTWLGKLRQFLLRPATVRLSAWGETNLLTRSRAPVSMLSAGFLARPLPERTSDVETLYRNGELPSPVAYRLELPVSEEKFWAKSARVRIYQIGSPLPARGTALENEAAAVRPFNLLRTTRWRPDQPAPGNLQEQVALGLVILLPSGMVACLVWFGRWLRRRKKPASWRELLIGNGLVLALLLSLALLAGELYFRFIYDTTDSLGYTRVSEKWVQRHWHVNAAGFRDNVEYEARVTPGRPRVSFFGDSFTAGHGIRNVENRFPNLLRRTHPDWEIHVLANVGLDTGSELVLLNRALGKGYELGHVVLVYCLNDIGDLLPAEGLQPAESAAGAARDSWILRNSYALNFLYHRYHAWRNAYARNYFPFVQSAYRGEAWERQKLRLKQFRDLVQANGGTFSVVTFPFLHALGADYEYAFAHETMDQFWRDLRVPHLDLWQVYLELTPEQLVVNPYDAHPNERASQLAAEALDRFLAPLVRASPPKPAE